MHTKEYFEKERAKFQQSLDQNCQLLERLTKEKAELTVRYKELSREVKKVERIQDEGRDGDQTERLVVLQMQIDDILNKKRTIDKELKGLSEKVEQIRAYLSEELPKLWEEQKRLDEQKQLEALQEQAEEEAQWQKLIEAARKIPQGMQTPFKKNPKTSILASLCAVSFAFTLYFLVTSFDYKLVISALICVFWGIMALISSTSQHVELTTVNRSEDAISTKVAGVTFENANGINRQVILQKAASWCRNRNVNGLPGYLEFYYFKDEPAVAVKTHFGQIGNIPQDNLSKLIPRFKNITKVIVYPDSFTKNDDVIFRADVAICFDDSQN